MACEARLMLEVVIGSPDEETARNWKAYNAALLSL